MINKPIHSSLGASSYNRWKNCPGSVNLSKNIPKTESSYALEGTRAHQLAADILLGNNIVKKDYTDEMFEAVKVYTDYIEGYIGHDLYEVDIESKLDLTSYHPDLYGTGDAILYNKFTKRMKVIDYKHGAGIAVEVKNNPQLMYYGLAAMHQKKQPVQELELIIVQPRCFHKDGPIRSWITNPMTILDFAADLVADAIKTEQQNAEINPGEWCKFCPALPMHCPKVRENSLAIAKEVFAPSTPYSPNKLAEVLHKIPILKAWIKSVETFAYGEAQKDRLPTGWKLVNKREIRQWNDNVNADKLQRHFRIFTEDFSKPEILKSPAQVEKFIPKEHKEQLQQFYKKKSSGTVLVPEEDKRPQITSRIDIAFPEEE